MDPYTMTIKLGSSRTRLLLRQGSDELMRASLPSPAPCCSARPARALLESMALWLDTRLRVVLSADEPATGSCLALTDERGTASPTLFYEVVTAGRARRRPVRLRGVDDFADLRQLSLLDAGGRR
jgi:hypothetical protein